MSATRVAPRASVLRADEAEAWIDSFAKLTRARLRTERRLRATPRYARRMAARAERRAIEQGRLAASEEVAKFIAVIAQERSALETVLPDLIAEGLRTILGDVALADAHLARAAQHALDEHLERGAAVLRVPPERVAGVVAALPAAARERLGVESDARLAGDRALLVFADAIIEAGLDAQVERLRLGLLESLGEPAPAQIVAETPVAEAPNDRPAAVGAR